jgi:hypothetical protein
MYWKYLSRIPLSILKVIFFNGVKNELPRRRAYEVLESRPLRYKNQDTRQNNPMPYIVTTYNANASRNSIDIKQITKIIPVELLL